jgi:lipopolysaccharide/colanic/teichoic acid biosynthesis glycosyltransferase
MRHWERANKINVTMQTHERERTSRMLKRTLDIVLSVSLLIVLLPLMVIIAILIKLDSRGPVCFIQERLGKDGVPFRMYKFRTMQEAAEKVGTGLCSYENDPRITRLGRWLRLVSVDEFPQLLNVIRGQMSIVGPRPPVTYELGNYNDLSSRNRLRFRVKPGITGLAQVSGRNALDWNTKIAFDNNYVALTRQYGIAIDIKILLLTVWVVASMQNVVERANEPMIETSPTSKQNN